MHSAHLQTQPGRAVLLRTVYRQHHRHMGTWGASGTDRPALSCMHHPHLGSFSQVTLQQLQLERPQPGAMNTAGSQEACVQTPPRPLPGCVTFISVLTTLGSCSWSVQAWMARPSSEGCGKLWRRGCSATLSLPSPPPGVPADHLVQGLQTDGSGAAYLAVSSSPHSPVTSQASGCSNTAAAQRPRPGQRSACPRPSAHESLHPVWFRHLPRNEWADWRQEPRIS